VQLHRDRDKFAAAGAELVVIGQGTPRHAEHFIEQHGVEGLRVLVDPDRTAYKLAGTKIGGVGDLFGPGVVAKGIMTSLRTGKVQGRVQGDAAQLGGVMIVMPGGEVAWTHLAEDAGDNAPPDEVLDALESAVKGSGKPADNG
jgi:hypothetical protein